MPCLTVSPFFHYNSADYAGNPNDFPTDTTDNRASIYAGAQVTFSADSARNSISAGYYGFYQHDSDFFEVLNFTATKLTVPLSWKS